MGACQGSAKKEPSPLQSSPFPERSRGSSPSERYTSEASEESGGGGPGESAGSNGVDDSHHETVVPDTPQIGLSRSPSGNDSVRSGDSFDLTDLSEIGVERRPSFNTDTKYEGERNAEGEADGYGKYIFPSGEVYIGEWKENRRQGKGKYTSANGNEYVGEFFQDKIQGEGKFTFSSGDIFEGTWKNNKKNGQGTFTFGSGNRFEGGWRDDMMHGYGKFMYKAGDFFEGWYQDDMKHGPGRATYNNGDVFEGEYQHDKKHGKGLMKWANGDVDVLKFVQGQRIGEGARWDVSLVKAHRLEQGKRVREVSIKGAAQIAKRIGLPVPAGAEPDDPGFQNAPLFVVSPDAPSGHLRKSPHERLNNRGTTRKMGSSLDDAKPTRRHRQPKGRDF